MLYNEWDGEDMYGEDLFNEQMMALNEELRQEALLAGYYQDEMLLLGPELEEDRDNFARSEEAGWFYDD